MSDEALARAFWALLATERAEMAGGLALANTEVPFYLSNAAWGANPARLGEVTPWYGARGLPSAVVVPGGGGAGLAERGFALELAFGFRAARGREGSSLVEQVGWAQLRQAGELLAAHYRQPGLALAIARSLVRAAQDDARVQTFLAYDIGGAAVGALTAFAAAGALAAMLLVDPDGALEARLAREAHALGLRARVFEAGGEGGLERWALA